MKFLFLILTMFTVNSFSQTIENSVEKFVGDSVENYKLNETDSFIIIGSHKYSLNQLIIPRIDSLIGYWGYFDSAVYYLDYHYYLKGCVSPSKIFDFKMELNDVKKLEIPCYNFIEYEILPHIVYCSLENIEICSDKVVYTFKHYLTLDGIQFDSYVHDPTNIKYALVRYFKISIADDVFDYKFENINCDQCFFPYSPIE